MVQYFKEDERELKFYNAGKNAFDVVTSAQESFFDGAYTASDFLLALYDAGRMPFADRVPRDAFVAFFLQAVPNFPFTGTFEAYLFILKSIFGQATEIFFEVPAPGKLSILVDAEASFFDDWVATEFIDGVYVDTPMVTWEGEGMEFGGVSGITSQAQLVMLLQEIIPQGIWTNIGLQVFDVSDWYAYEGVGDEETMVDHTGDKIVFFELV